VSATAPTARGRSRSGAPRRAALALLFCAGLPLASAADGTVAVRFENASSSTRCAEEDNVDVRLSGDGIRRLRIAAEHPPYIASVIEDSTAPDFTSCDMSQDPSFPFVPRTVVLYEDAAIRLVGHAFATFWRPGQVDFRVGTRSEPGLHLVQLLRRGPPRDIEILVVYPSDGYWRLKPLPPPALADSAYGSSFLFGPIEQSSRPYVAIRGIEFDPAAMRFRVAFADGSRGVLAVESATRDATVLALGIDPPVAAGRPFAALRSMFVTTAQADVATAWWRGGGTGDGAAPILGFREFRARHARFGRTEPSRHNTSAPDLVFDGFGTAPAR
jgi:hypothetical protein